MHQELTDAALACGPKAVSLFNRFQTIFNKELRRSDATMLSMFKRKAEKVINDTRLKGLKKRVEG